MQTFREEQRRRLGGALDELYAAERLLRRLEQLEAQMAIAREPEARKARAAPSQRSRDRSPAVASPHELPAGREAPDSDELPSGTDLKELYRRLARSLHPDFAESEEDRARLSTLMAQVNAAYSRGDRVRLELIAGRLGSAGAALEPSREARIAHAERRISSLSPLIASLEREHRRILSTATFRDLEKERRHAEAGRDYFAEALYELRRKTRATVSDALDRAARLDSETLALRRALKGSAASPASSHLIRRAALHPERQRLSDDARRLARELRASASTRPWTVLLSLFALFGEVSSEAPEGLSSIREASARYGQLSPEWPLAPPLEQALTRLPWFLELGLRMDSGGLRFGVQVRRADLLAGIHAALRTDEIRGLARRALELLGPSERCRACHRDVFLVHLFRIKGLDRVHGLVCPRCAAVQESYRSLGRPRGLETLSPYALLLGAVEEQVVRLAGVSIRLQLLPHERRRLTCRMLSDRLTELYASAFSSGLRRRHIQLRVGRRLLAPSSLVPKGASVGIALDSAAPLSEAELLALLREHIGSRFKGSGRSRIS